MIRGRDVVVLFPPSVSPGSPGADFEDLVRWVWSPAGQPGKPNQELKSTTTLTKVGQHARRLYLPKALCRKCGQTSIFPSHGYQHAGFVLTQYPWLPWRQIKLEWLPVID